jgi:putative phosphoribosyl transferase
MHSTQQLFRDRAEAGRLLAAKLLHYVAAPDTRPSVVVLALPRGGVPVAFEVAKALEAPLDVVLVRKLGVPGHRELAMGAIASGGFRVVNQDVAHGLGLPAGTLDAVQAVEERELRRRESTYRGDQAPLELRDRIVIIVDDGLATGSTMRVAVRSVRQHRPSRIVVAVPAAPPEVCEDLRAEVDEVVCGITPTSFHAVGVWYEDFSQTSDQEVQALLHQSRKVHKV